MEVIKRTETQVPKLDRTFRLALSVSLLSASVLTAGAAHSQVTLQNNVEPVSDVVVRFGAGHTDNVFRGASNPESGSFTALGALVNYARDTTRLTATVVGDIEFRSFSTDGAEDEPYGDLNARVDIHAVPDRFVWVITDQLGQGRLDPFRAIGPNNQEQINIFSTGPALFVPLGERTQMRLSSLVGRRSFEESVGFDNDTLESAIGFFRQQNSTTEIGVNFVRRDVEFADAIFDNSIDRAYVSYDKVLSSGQASLQVGSNSIDYGSTSETYPFFNVGWEREVTARSGLSIALENSLVDTSDSFRGGNVGFDETLRTRDVYERSNGQINFNMNLGRSQIVLGASFGQDKYENETTLDNEFDSLQFGFERTVSPLMNAGVDLRLTNRDFRNVLQKDEDLIVALWVDRSFGRKLSMNFSLERLERDGTNTAAYEENIVQVMLQFTPNSGASVP